MRKAAFALLVGVVAGTFTGALLALVFGTSIGSVPVIAAGAGAGVASGFALSRPVKSNEKGPLQV